jgi:hypothetical protein
VIGGNSIGKLITQLRLPGIINHQRRSRSHKKQKRDSVTENKPAKALPHSNFFDLQKWQRNRKMTETVFWPEICDFD